MLLDKLKSESDAAWLLWMQISNRDVKPELKLEALRQAAEARERYSNHMHSRRTAELIIRGPRKVPSDYCGPLPNNT